MNFSRNLFYLYLLTILALITNVNAVNSKQQDAKCLLPMEPGPCRMTLNRFYYNAKTDTCEEFKFGGCKGNDNKFGFKQTCEEACKKSVSSGAAASTTTSPAGKDDMTSKQLNGNTLKTITSVVDRTTSTTTTTPNPRTTRTTVKSRTTTTRSKPTTTTQNSKAQI